jgi:hypothetical protein
MSTQLETLHNSRTCSALMLHMLDGVPCRLPSWLHEQVLRVQERFALSHGAMLGLGALFVVLVAALFIALLDFTLVACPGLLLPREHVD